MSNENNSNRLYEFSGDLLKSITNEIFSYAHIYGVKPHHIDLVTQNFDPKLASIEADSKKIDNINNAALGLYSADMGHFMYMLNMFEQKNFPIYEALRSACRSLECHKLISRSILLMRNGLITKNEAGRLELCINEWENYRDDEKLIAHLTKNEEHPELANPQEPDFMFYATYPNIDAKSKAKSLLASWDCEFNLMALEAGADHMCLLHMQDIRGSVLQEMQLSDSIYEPIANSYRGSDYLRGYHFSKNDPDLTITINNYYKQKSLTAWYARMVACFSVGNIDSKTELVVKQIFEENTNVQDAYDQLAEIGYFDVQIEKPKLDLTRSDLVLNESNFVSALTLNFTKEKIAELLNALPEMFEIRCKNVHDLTEKQWELINNEHVFQVTQMHLTRNLNEDFLNLAIFPGPFQNIALECIRSQMARNAMNMLTALRLMRQPYDEYDWRVMRVAMSIMAGSEHKEAYLKTCIDGEDTKELPLDLIVCEPDTLEHEFQRKMQRWQAGFSNLLVNHKKNGQLLSLEWIEYINRKPISVFSRSKTLLNNHQQFFATGIPRKEFLDIYKELSVENRELFLILQENIYYVAMGLKGFYLHADYETTKDFREAIRTYITLSHNMAQRLSNELYRIGCLPSYLDFWRYVSKPLMNIDSDLNTDEDNLKE